MTTNNPGMIAAEGWNAEAVFKAWKDDLALHRPTLLRRFNDEKAGWMQITPRDCCHFLHAYLNKELYPGAVSTPLPPSLPYTLCLPASLLVIHNFLLVGVLFVAVGLA